MVHTIRCREGGTVEVDNYTIGKAVKLQCTECLGWGEEHPEKCGCPLCPLYPFRGICQAGYSNKPKTPRPERPKMSMNPKAREGLEEYRRKKREDKLNVHK
jgi:hypothetical protein